MFGVETHSFLPDQQSDRRDFPCQGETRHRGLHPSSNYSDVELLEWSRYGSSSGRGTLEDIFQIMIVIGVEPSDRQQLLGAFELSLQNAVFPAGRSLQNQAAVGPKLSLGAS